MLKFMAIHCLTHFANFWNKINIELYFKSASDIFYPFLKWILSNWLLINWAKRISININLKLLISSPILPNWVLNISLIRVRFLLYWLIWWKKEDGKYWIETHFKTSWRWKRIYFCLDIQNILGCVLHVKLTSSNSHMRIFEVKYVFVAIRKFLKDNYRIK